MSFVGAPAREKFYWFAMTGEVLALHLYCLWNMVLILNMFILENKTRLAIDRSI